MFSQHYFCAPHESQGSQKRVLDPLGPELQMVVSCHLGAGNRIPGPLQGWPVLLATEASFNLGLLSWGNPLPHMTQGFCSKGSKCWDLRSSMESRENSWPASNYVLEVPGHAKPLGRELQLPTILATAPDARPPPRGQVAMLTGAADPSLRERPKQWLEIKGATGSTGETGRLSE